MKMSYRSIALWIVAGLLVVGLFSLFAGPPDRDPPNQVAYSDFLDVVNRGQVSEVTVKGRSITYSVADGRTYTTRAMSDPGLVDRLMAKNVRFKSVRDDDDVPTPLSILVNCLPLLLLVAVWIYFTRQIRDAVRRKQ